MTQISSMIYVGISSFSLLWLLLFAPSSAMWTSSSSVEKAKRSKRAGRYHVVYTGGYRHGK